MIRLLFNQYTDPDAARDAELRECESRNISLGWLEVHPVDGRPTFAEMFELANAIGPGPDDITVIANSDIYFDESLKLTEQMNADEVFSLGRHDVMPDGEVAFDYRKDAQDAWIFRGPIRACGGGDYRFGILGCDNKIAYELADCGYQVSNPAFSIKAHHLHNTELRRTASDRSIQLDPPYLIVPPCRFDLRVPEIFPREVVPRILHFALITPQSPQYGLRDAIASIGEEYREFDWMRYGSDVETLRSDLLEAVEEFRPDLVFFQIQTPGILTPEVLRKIPAVKIEWCGDVRDETPQHYFDRSSGMTCQTFTNLRDVEAVRVAGGHAEYLQVGFSPGVFSPGGRPFPVVPDVVFLGNHYPGRFPCSDQRAKMVYSLKARYGKRFGVYGNGWDQSDCWLPEEAEAAVYRKCKIAIDCNHYDDVPRFFSDRRLRIMGSGAFCIANQNPGIENEFEVGKHLVTFKSIEEIPGIVDYYIEHESERIAIAEAGCLHVRRNHTWGARMPELLRMAKQYGGLGTRSRYFKKAGVL